MFQYLWMLTSLFNIFTYLFCSEQAKRTERERMKEERKIGEKIEIEIKEKLISIKCLEVSKQIEKKIDRQNYGEY